MLLPSSCAAMLRFLGVVMAGPAVGVLTAPQRDGLLPLLLSSLSLLAILRAGVPAPLLLRAGVPVLTDPCCRGATGGLATLR